MRRGVILPDEVNARRRTAATLPAELRVRGVQVLASLSERVGLALGNGGRGKTAAPRGVARTVRAAPASIAAAARARFAEGLLPGLRDLSGTISVLRRARPEAESNTRCRADRSVDGVFDLLGHERVSFGAPTDWHLDPASETRAPMKHWSRIAYLDPAIVGDYKLLWELNRHQHFVTLGQAYAYSRDSRYADAFVRQLSSWIAANPPHVGVNWASSLEVSYRAISWLWALQLFADAPELTDDLLLTALESLRRHASHITRYLSTYYSPNTHLTGEALGLLYLGTALPVFESASRWRAQGWDILREQLFRQVRTDGTYFEQALYYHRYTADIYHHALLLAESNGWPVDAAIRARVELLDECLVHATHPDGTVPLVGDDDGGRLMRLDGMPTRDARPTLATGAALFGRSDMRYVAGDAVEECLWLMGTAGATALSARPAAIPAGGSRAFRDGGLYVMRDGWGAGATWALLDGGPHGSLNCGHAHADALSMELAIGGRSLLTDGGTFSYTGAERDRFRATSSHNSVTVDNESSSVMRGLFHWQHIARTTVHSWASSAGADFWCGSHDGYARLTDPARHKRSVLFLHGRYFVVMDAIEADRAHDWSVHWHCAPDVRAQQRGASDVQVVDPSRADLALLQLVVLGAGRLMVDASWRSEAYGAKQEAVCVSYASSGTGRQGAVSILVPGTSNARTVADSEGQLSAEVVGAQFKDTIVHRGDSAKLDASGVLSDAGCAITTRSGDGSPQTLYLMGASYAEGAGLNRQRIASDTLFTARYELGRWCAEPLVSIPVWSDGMCGICGIVIPDHASRSIDEPAFTRLRDTMAHRGPDGFGVFMERGVALGHRRLSIVDVSHGQQPMASDDGSLQLVYNGEVFNHPELRAQLEATGVRYRTSCDTETVIRIFERRGEAAPEELRGMFAYAMWDRRTRTLTLARDRFGVKPLYYSLLDDGTLVFGSEMKAILASGMVRASLREDALPDYLANHATSGEGTLLEGIKRLLPGHTLVWQNGTITTRCYWDLRFEAEAEDTRADADLIAEYAERLKEAVRLRLMADVPLGAFLSGGIDSATITALMSQLVQEPIKTFSVGFAEREANELSYARIVAKAFATDHHEVLVSPEQFFGALPSLVWHEDEPIAHPSSVALNFVSRLAAERVKVVLTGEGSDETLAGYGRYTKTIMNMRLGRTYQSATPAAFRTLVRHGIEALPASRTRQRALRTFLARPATLEALYLDNFAVFSRAEQGGLLSSAVRHRLTSSDPYATATKLMASSDATTLLDRLLYVDTKTYLHELLMKQDQMSMAASIESRVPFLDHPLVEFTARLPERMKIRGGTTKYILREAMRHVLPAEILTRGKMGFPVPVGAWFRGPYRGVVDELVLSPRALDRGLFDPSAIRSIVARHAAGEDHAERLWSLVNLEIWHRVVVEGEPADQLHLL